jgi:hypothetical protein
VSPDSLGTIAAAQREFSQHTAQTRADALLESLDPSTTEGRSGRTRLLCCACRPASAWLDTLPLTKSLELKSGEVRAGLRHCLGISMLPSEAPAVQCDCGAPLRPTDVDHGMLCPSLSAHTTLRHDILKRILRRVVHRATLPPPRNLPSDASLGSLGERASPLPVLAPGWKLGGTSS